jgi:1-acyl-sn-glycerol-3-phosphate acyltransferase
MPPAIANRNTWLLRTTRTLSKICLPTFFQIETTGQSHLPIGSAFVLLSKHQRWEDIPLLDLATPRPLYYMAKYELFMNPVVGWFLSSLGGVPLNRSRPLESRRSLKRMLELLQDGAGIVVFPEGTYYVGKMGPGRPGLVRMVLTRMTPLFIPVGIRYSRQRFRTRVQITFGEPVRKQSAMPIAEFLDRMMAEIARLSGL